MKKLIFAVVIAALSLYAVDQASDFYSESYASFINRQQALMDLQDASGATAILALPDSDAVTTNITYSYVASSTSYVGSVTSVVQTTSYTPLSWDTTLWPIANTNGIPYQWAVITNPPTTSITDVYTTGAVDSVEIFLTNTLYAFNISNIWINTSPGSTNGWKLVQ